MVRTSNFTELLLQMEPGGKHSLNKRKEGMTKEHKKTVQDRSTIEDLAVTDNDKKEQH